MLWFARTTQLALLGFILGAATGCFQSHPCSTEELCNEFDDDCDGKIDEGFVDEEGRYTRLQHCGRCGVSCAEVFASAATTACEVPESGGPACVLESCPMGTRASGVGACVPEAAVLCLPCQRDEDCQVSVVGAICVQAGDGADAELRCGLPCEEGCPEGTVCQAVDGGARTACLPSGGSCRCNAGNEGSELGCLVERDTGFRCAGIRVCAMSAGSPEGFEFGPCLAALEEVCNGQDDDCDGAVDERFVDAAGRYLGPDHCGACGVPCVSPGPNAVATCLPDGTGAQCDVQCAEGFVDVDGIAANGCECERFDGEGPPPALGTDRDCDGVVDDSDAFVYVSVTGSDGDPGTLVRPVRTLDVGARIARAENKDVLVSRGTYDGGYTIVAGVNVFGGYRPDFRDRDLELFPVLLENRSGGPGAPVLTCTNVTLSAVVDGFQIVGSDALADGTGSTAVFLDGCGDGVQLRDLTILAGRGANGRRGNSSSDELLALGIGGLAELDGTPGGNGASTINDCTSGAGVGGIKTCTSTGGRLQVSGGDGGAGACPDLACNQRDACGNAGCTDFTTGGVCDLSAALAVAVSNPAALAGQGAAPGAPGEQTYNAPTNRGTCNFCDDNPTIPRLGAAGGMGAAGVPGGSGGGCDTPPRLVDGRLVSAVGGAGSAGTNGSGGGGGSGGSGYSVIGGTLGTCNDVAGGSGAGGGSGGCGAPGATGGQGGGASVGLLVQVAPGFSTAPTVERIRIVTASGGAGGDGGFGAAGGSGGLGGQGGSTAFFCARAGGAGGVGGAGGAGGAGGGGCGGGSHGIVVIGNPSAAYQEALRAGTTIDVAGIAGRGGRGGFGPTGSGGAGAEGSNEPVFRLE